jgi:AmmeMemoRadiSam system protein B
MTVRKRCLPRGWYPEDEAGIKKFLTGLPEDKRACAVIAPHAGWFYAGKIAARAVAALDRNAQTLVVIGGHLSAGMLPLFAEEDTVWTPLGLMEIDAELRTLLRKEACFKGSAADLYMDNTVEVLLPMARYFFPESRLLWLRLPGEPGSFDAGKCIARIGKALDRRLAVIGSTDLTHYGVNYGFCPKGSGKAALDWVRTLIDRAFREAVLGGDPAKVLARAQEDCSACSVGAVLGAMGFATELGAGNRELLAYGTSADALGDLPDSFVGYAAMTYTWPAVGVVRSGAVPQG